MTASLLGVVQTTYDQNVHPRFQSEGNLIRGRYNHVTEGVIGDTFQFRVLNQVVAVPYAGQGMINPVNAQYVPVSAQLVTWIASDLVTMPDQTKVNFNIVQNSSKVLVYSINRRVDQILIDALDAASSPYTVTSNDGTFNYLLFEEAYALLAANSAIMYGELSLLLSARGQQDLMQQAQLTNTFYMDFKPIAGHAFNRAHIQEVMLIVIPTMPEGGLPFDANTNTRTSFMFHSEALGGAAATLPTVLTSYENLYVGYVTNCLLKMGAVGIDTKGIVNIYTTEA